MREKLKEYALVAEIVSSIMVVLSLVFVVIEIRENTESLRRSSYDSITESLIEWRRDHYIDPVVREVMLKRENGEALSTDERHVFRVLGVNLYQQYERAFWANQYGQMGRSEWERFERLICGAKEGWWSSSAEQFSTKDFVEFVDSCSD